MSDCDTLRLHSAADVATWQPEMNYGRSWDPTLDRQLRVVVLVSTLDH